MNNILINTPFSGGQSLEQMTADADATAGQILSGKSAYVDGEKITGTMTNNGAVAPAALNAGGSYTIPAGYHNGSGKVTTNTLASQTNGDATAAQILSGKIAYVDGAKVTGSMTNRGAVKKALAAGGSYTIPAGYHNGSGKVTANTLASQTAGTATAADIATGKTAWVAGKKLTGTSNAKKFGMVDVTLSYDSDSFSASDLDFTPSAAAFYLIDIGSNFYNRWIACGDSNEEVCIMGYVASNNVRYNTRTLSTSFEINSVTFSDSAGYDYFIEGSVYRVIYWA